MRQFIRTVLTTACGHLIAIVLFTLLIWVLPVLAPHTA